jgi:5'-phosphate synthase pdxT subunit
MKFVMTRQPTIGILALQGAFHLHSQVLSRLGVPHRLVKTIADLRQADALILPGGESTTMRWFFQTEDMTEEMARFVHEKPVLGTCAGMILLARRVADDLVDYGFGAIDIDVRRNAYGRQVHSHAVEGEIDLGAGPRPFTMIFIRAPRIERVGEGVQVLGTRDGEPTMVANKNVLATSFHPELSDSDELHRFFVTRFVTGGVPNRIEDPPDVRRASATGN